MTPYQAYLLQFFTHHAITLRFRCCARCRELPSTSSASSTATGGASSSASSSAAGDDARARSRRFERGIDGFNRNRKQRLQVFHEPLAAFAVRVIADVAGAKPTRTDSSGSSSSSSSGKAGGVSGKLFLYSVYVILWFCGG